MFPKELNSKHFKKIIYFPILKETQPTIFWYFSGLLYVSAHRHLFKRQQFMIFSRKTKKLLHPCLFFNNIPLKNSISQKHLGLKLDVTLNFVEYMKNIIQKISKKMGAFRRFQPILPRSSLLTIYKTFIRSHLDFADVIHGQAYISLYIIKSRR